jgi:hypothetical protein
MTDTTTVNGDHQAQIMLKHAEAQRRLAYVLFGFSFGILALVSYMAMHSPQDRTEMVFTTITTLIGTWVGTLLAFYFARENFEAASRSMQQTISRLSPDERLRTVPIEQAMLRREEIVSYDLKTGENIESVPLDEIKKKFALDEKVTRLPILNSDGSICGVLHESELTKFLAANQNITAPTIANMTADPKLREKLNLFGVVAINRTLRDAKTAMESQKGCHDVFVTQTGAATEKVLGWVTNVGILAAMDV